MGSSSRADSGESASCWSIDIATRCDDLYRVDLRLGGEIDLSNADQLGVELERVFREGFRMIVINVAAIRFLGCAGLAELARAHQRQHRAGGVLILTYPTAMIRRALGISGLDTVLTVLDGEPPGVDTFRGSPAGLGRFPHRHPSLPSVHA